VAARLNPFWWAVLISVVLSTLLILGLAGFGFWYLRAHGFSVRVPLGGQRMTVVLPSRLAVQARVTSNPQARIDTRIPVDVPLAQTLTVPLRQDLHATVHFDHDVPLHTTIDYHGSVHVHQSIPLDATVHASVLGMDLEIPVKGNIPIDTTIPVDLQVPVDQSIHLRFQAPIRAHLDEALRVPLHGTIHSDVVVDHRFSVALPEALAAEVDLPKNPVPITVKSWDLKLTSPSAKPAPTASAAQDRP
jgi:hypothetical protein